MCKWLCGRHIDKAIFTGLIIWLTACGCSAPKLKSGPVMGHMGATVTAAYTIERKVKSVGLNPELAWMGKKDRLLTDLGSKYKRVYYIGSQFGELTSDERYIQTLNAMIEDAKLHQDTSKIAFYQKCLDLIQAKQKKMLPSETFYKDGRRFIMTPILYNDSSNDENEGQEK